MISITRRHVSDVSEGTFPNFVGNIGRMKFHKLRSIPSFFSLARPPDITTLLVIIAPQGKGGKKEEEEEEEKGKGGKKWFGDERVRSKTPL